MDTIQVTNVNGEYKCDINISVDEWVEILRDPELTTPQRWNALMGFYCQASHKSTCTDVAKRLKVDKDTIEEYIRTWGQAIQEKLNRFQVLGVDDEKPPFWIIVMTGKQQKKSVSWKVRRELAEAIDKILPSYKELFLLALEQFKKELTDPNSTYWSGDKKEKGEYYKWEAIQHFQKHWDIDARDFGEMFKEATAKTGNLLAHGKANPKEVIQKCAENESERTRELFRKLFDESNEINYKSRINEFLDKVNEFIEELRNKFGKKINLYYFKKMDINAATTFLWLKYPDKYYKYQPKFYVHVCKFFHLKNDYTIKLDGSVESAREGFRMYDKIREDLQKDTKLVNIINSLLHKDTTTLYQDPEFRTATIDFGYFISTHFIPDYNSIFKTNTKETDMNTNPIVNLLKTEKNIILQGAPGTGKTYSTAAIALGILGVKDVDFNNHSKVMERYKELINKQIFFTTFHQSMDYEDFVEGLKPKIRYDDDDKKKAIGITYETEDGIFKEACKAAGDNSKLKEYIQDFIRKITGFENKYTFKTLTGVSTVNAWVNRGNSTIYIRSTNAKPENQDDPYHSPTALNIDKVIAQAMGDEEGENNWPRYAQAFINTVKEVYQWDEKATRPVVLIIDEINRGNVSKIFGELITLIEADKRAGCTHPVPVTLPYSKVPFIVPKNLYIIGTMNTTDRTTGTIDYAVRRRFAFVTLKADREVIQSDTAKKLFDNVEKFIGEYRIDDTAVEDLMVGHSYFMTEKDEPDIDSADREAWEDQLKAKIQYKVIPLLKEYINDGILQRKPDEQQKYFDSWLDLKPYTEQKNAKESDSSEAETPKSEGEEN